MVLSMQSPSSRLRRPRCSIPLRGLALVFPLLYLAFYFVIYRHALKTPSYQAPKPPPGLSHQSLDNPNHYRNKMIAASLWNTSVLPSDNTTRSLHTCHTRQRKILRMPAVPDFIIVGMQKAGTSAIYVILSEHPDIILPKRFEAHFFTRRLKSTLPELQKSPRLACEARKQYANLLLDESDQLNVSKTWFTFEKTPAYVVSEQVPGLIQQLAPWAKIVVVLRHPADRAYSHFKMKYDRQEFAEHSTFDQALAGQLHELAQHGLINLDSVPEWLHLNKSATSAKDEYEDSRGWKFANMLYRSYYADQLRVWLDHFTLGESLFLIRYERLDQNPQSVMDELLNFLKIPPYKFSSQIMGERYNPNRKDPLNITAPPMRNETRKFLDTFFAPWNDELADLVGEDWRDVWKENFNDAQ